VRHIDVSKRILLKRFVNKDMDLISYVGGLTGRKRRSI
jgi:hypothetical protein